MKHLKDTIAAATLAAALLLGGCGLPLPDEPAAGSVEAACAGVPADLDAEAPGRPTVIAVDATASQSSTQRRAEVLTTVEQLVRLAVRDRAPLTMLTYGSSSTRTKLTCIDQVPMAPAGSNESVIAGNEALLPSRVAAVMGATLAQPLEEASDPTAGLIAAGDAVRALGGGGRVYVLGDGVGTTGCAALPSSSTPGEVTLTAELVDEIVARCENLPRLDGLELYWGGVGRSDTPVSTEAASLLIDLWTRICEGTAAASCMVTDAAAPPVAEQTR